MAMFESRPLNPANTYCFSTSLIEVIAPLQLIAVAGSFCKMLLAAPLVEGVLYNLSDFYFNTISFYV